jgi:uncharacterized repeat protein (TIGR03803 family)
VRHDLVAGALAALDRIADGLALDPTVDRDGPHIVKAVSIGIGLVGRAGALVDDDGVRALAHASLDHQLGDAPARVVEPRQQRRRLLDLHDHVGLALLGGDAGSWEVIFAIDCIIVAAVPDCPAPATGTERPAHMACGSIIFDAAGNLFGTTQGGGANNAGTVFEITKTANGYSSTPTVLVSFNGTNGNDPYGNLIMDAHGDLLGTTWHGGANGYGVVYEVVKTATGYSSTPVVLTSFNGTNANGSTGALLMDGAGNLFGTSPGNTVFELPVASSTPISTVDSTTTVINTDPPIPPTVTITSAAEASNVASQTITGTVTPGSGTVVGRTVTLKDNGTTIGTAIVQSNGSFSVTVTLPNQGTNAIVASVTDSLGSTGTSAAVVDTLDNIAPTVTITSAAVPGIAGAQTISGSVVSGGTATVTGQTVTLTDNGSLLGTANVQSNGSFSTSVILPDQCNNAIFASVTDSYGNTNNTYLATTGAGQIAINAQQGTGTTNDLDFTGGLTDQNLWFLQSGNNLQIDILGTNTSVTVNNWFSSSSPDQLQEIAAGGLKIDNQLSQLVQAMASYASNNPGFDPASSGTSMPTDSSLQSTIAAAWHS